MPGPFLHRQLLPIIVVFLTVLAVSAGAEAPDRVDSAPGNEAGDAVEPAAAFPMGRIEPVPVELEYDPLFDEYDEDQEDSEVYDPLEPGNRAVYGFNRQVDRFLFNPVTKGYRTVVPDFARRSIRRVFLNLNAPIYVMNNLFQLRLLDAVQTVGAFTMNMTFGFGGLFELVVRFGGLRLCHQTAQPLIRRLTLRRARQAEKDGQGRPKNNPLWISHPNQRNEK